MRGGAGWPALIVAAAVAGQVLDDYALAVATSILIYAILGLGLNVVVGYAGMLDLGFAAFYAIGAYVSALLMLDLHWSLWASLPVVVAAAALAGVVIGYPTLRLRSDYLAIVTLGFGEITRITVTNLDVTGGPNGLTGLPPVTVAGHELVSPRDLFHLALAFFAVVVAVTALISRSRLAHAWRAIRRDDRAAEAIGVPTRRAKLLAYVIGAAVGSLAGPLSAAQLGTVDPSNFTFLTSLLVLFVVIIGGLGSRPGVLLGAAVVVGLPEVLRSVQDVRGLVFGVVVIVLIIARPQGMWPARRRRLGGRPGVRPARVERPPAGAAGPLLEVDGLARSFGGVLAVADLDLTVAAGEVVSLIGPNGAGKTTAFNCITGTVAPHRGRVLLGGRSLLGLPPHRIAAAGLARTFQSSRLFDDMSVAENVLAGCFARPAGSGGGMLRGTSAADLEAVHRCLDVVGLTAAADRGAGELAHGDRRRLEIARALAGDPRVLLLDEPAAGANPAERQGLIGLIGRIRALGVAILLIEHDVALVMAVSDRVVVLDHGRTVAAGLPAEIQNDPRVVAAYLGEPDPGEARLLCAAPP